MNISKAQMKMTVIAELGNEFDDMLEAATAQQSQSVGAGQASVQIEQNIRSLVTVIEKDFDEGKVKIAIGEGDLAVLGLIKQYMSRAISTCEVTREHYEQRKSITVGKVEAHKQAIALMKKAHSKEVNRIERALAAVEDDSPAGSGPGPNIKAQRTSSSKLTETMTDEELERHLLGE